MSSHAKGKGLIFIIAGPSGSGKTTLAAGLLRTRLLKNMLARSLSLTTRPKRSGERDKKDYLFISGPEFKRRLKQKKILEWTKYLGYYYATPKDFIDKQIRGGRHPLLCLDLKGAGYLKRLYPKNSVAIFILPPSLQELRRRIKHRCRKAQPEEIAKRLQLAKKELLLARRYDYQIVNRNFREALRRLQDIVCLEIVNRRGD